MPARFTAVPKEKPAKAEARRATQYKTRQGARREFNPNNNYDPPPSENLVRYQANPKKPMPRSFPCGAITKLSHYMGSLKTTTPTSLGPQIPNPRLRQPPVRKS